MFQIILLILFILSVPLLFLDRINRIYRIEEEDVLTQRPGDPKKDGQDSFPPRLRP